MTANFTSILCPKCGEKVLTNAAKLHADFRCPECGHVLPTQEPESDAEPPTEGDESSMENEAITAMRQAVRAQQTRIMERPGKLIEEPTVLEKPAAPPKVKPAPPVESPPPLAKPSGAEPSMEDEAITAMRMAVEAQQTRTMSRSGRIAIAKPEKKPEEDPFPSAIEGPEKDEETPAAMPFPLKFAEPEQVIDPKAPCRDDLTTVPELRQAIEEQEAQITTLSEQNDTMGNQLRHAQMECQIHEENYELVKDQLAAALERSSAGQAARQASRLQQLIEDAESEKHRIVDEAQRQFKQIKEDAEHAVRTGVGKATGQFKVKIQDDAAEIPQQVKSVKNEIDEIRSLMTQRIREIAAKVDENDALRSQARNIEEQLGVAATQRQAAEKRVMELEGRVEYSRLKAENQQAQEATSAMRLEVAELVRQATDARTRLVEITGDNTIPPLPQADPVKPEQPTTPAAEKMAAFDLDNFELDVDISLDLDEPGQSKGDF